MLGIGLHLTQSVRLELDVTGGATETIFPVIDKMLTDSTEFQEALAFVAARKDMRRYRSMVDFLVCELVPFYQGGCFRYYDGKGPQLKKLINEETRVRLEWRMQAALEIAKERMEEKRRLSWTKFVQAVTLHVKKQQEAR